MSAAEIWRSTPYVQHVVDYSDNEMSGLLASRLRQVARFDAAIFFDNDWKSALAVLRAGIPIRVGRAGGLVSRLYNQHPPRPRTAVDLTTANLEIAQSIGANINPEAAEQQVY
jgi:ADP-heptose:LPS heptosyltransferase